MLINKNYVKKINILLLVMSVKVIDNILTIKFLTDLSYLV